MTPKAETTGSLSLKDTASATIHFLDTKDVSEIMKLFSLPTLVAPDGTRRTHSANIRDYLSALADPPVLLTVGETIQMLTDGDKEETILYIPSENRSIVSGLIGKTLKDAEPTIRTNGGLLGRTTALPSLRHAETAQLPDNNSFTKVVRTNPECRLPLSEKIMFIPVINSENAQSLAGFLQQLLSKKPVNAKGIRDFLAKVENEVLQVSNLLVFYTPIEQSAGKFLEKTAGKD